MLDDCPRRMLLGVHMIGVLGLDLGGDELDLSYRTAPLNERSGMPVLMAIGDPEAGPLIGLFYDAPSTPEQLAGDTDLTPAHSHPCDNFRVVMKGELWVGQERYHHGEFRLQRSGRPYGADGDAPHVEGNWRIISFADRRGHRVRPTNPELRKQYSSPEVIERMKDYYGDLLPVILPDEDDGVQGLVTTIDKPFSKQLHIDATFDEAGTWDDVGDARIAVSIMGVHDVGPVYIVQHTPAGAVATPSMTFDSDVFRCVIDGTALTGGTTLEMGDTRTRPPGTTWDEVIAGPDGLNEVIIVGDRRGAAPTVLGDDLGEWADYLASTVARLQTGLDALVTA
jgi:hypothetical protein